jgi:hypothetical protein
MREALKQRGLVHAQDTEGSGSATNLLQALETRCCNLARRIVSIIKHHILSDSQFFEFDSTLARDGCFFAGFLLAGDGGTEEEVGYCLQALKRMRWVFSDADGRAQTVTVAWEARTRNPHARSPSSSSGESSPHSKIRHIRPIPPPIAIPSFPSSNTSGFPETGASFDSQWMTPPCSATSSTQSLQDIFGTSPIHSSPASSASRRASARGSPTPAFIAPSLLHSASSFPQTSTATDDTPHMPHMLFYGDDVPTYQLHASPSTLSSNQAIQTPHTAMALRPQYPASPHTLISGSSSPSNGHDHGVLYSSQGSIFDARFPTFESPLTLPGSSGGLDPAFDLHASFF